MQKLLVRWVCNVVALFVAAWILSGISYGDQWWTLFIAAAVFTLINDWIVPDFEIRTFWWGVLAAIIVSIVNGLLNMVMPDDDDRGRAQVRVERY
jgi:uncharacterized membrane protein YvlD (DUF360 family)